MALGNILRAAREEKGLSTSQIADATHMMVQVVEELEREDFRRFAAAIYGRGFVRLYADYLGIDPAPLIKEFNELYSGARRPQVATRKLAEAPERVMPTTAQPQEKEASQPAVPISSPSVAAPAAAAAAPTSVAPAPTAAASADAAAKHGDLLSDPSPPETTKGEEAQNGIPPPKVKVPLVATTIEELLAPTAQEGAAAPWPDEVALEAADDGAAKDLDLFSVMANHAFGGEPHEKPKEREVPQPDPIVTTRVKSEKSHLIGELLEQRPLRGPSPWQRLSDWSATTCSSLVGVFKRQPLWLAGASLCVVLLLIALLLIVKHPGRTTPGTAISAPPPAVAAHTAPPSPTSQQLLKPPEIYAD